MDELNKKIGETRYKLKQARKEGKPMRVRRHLKFKLRELERERDEVKE